MGDVTDKMGDWVNLFDNTALAKSLLHNSTPYSEIFNYQHNVSQKFFIKKRSYMLCYNTRILQPFLKNSEEYFNTPFQMF